MANVESLKVIHSILKDVTSVKICDLNLGGLYSHLSKVEASILDAETQLAKVIASWDSVVSKVPDVSGVESSLTQRTLDVAFFDRLEELGVTRDVATKLFADPDFYAVGAVVTEVFLGEKWERPEITFLYLGFNIHKFIGILQSHGYDYVDSVPTDWSLPRSWGCLNFLKCVDDDYIDDGSSIRIIFSSSTNESSDAFTKRMFAMTPEKATDFIRLDFLKTFYNGKCGDEMCFTIMKPVALSEKKTFLGRSVSWKTWMKRGFSISPTSIPISKITPKIPTSPRSFPPIETPSPPSTSSPNDPHVTPSPSTSSSPNDPHATPSHSTSSSPSSHSHATPSHSSRSFKRKGRMTMLESFYTCLEEIGINHRFVRDLLDNRLAIASGSIVTQAVLGEVWSDDGATHFTLLETSVNSISTSLNANGYFVHDIMTDRVVYVKHLNDLNAPGVSAKIVMITVVKYDASTKSRHHAILNVTDDTFDGVKFSVLNSTKERIKRYLKRYSNPNLESVCKAYDFKLATVTSDMMQPKTLYDTFNPTI